MMRALWLVPLFAVMACAANEIPAGGGSRCVGKCDGVETTLLLRCTPDESHVECVAVVPENLPVDGVELLLFEQGRTDGVANSKRLPRDGSFRAAPGARVRVIAGFTTKSGETFRSLDDNEGFELIEQTIVLDGEKTVVLDAPFDLWRIEMSGDVLAAEAVLDPHTVTLTPWHVEGKTVDTIERKAVSLPFVQDPLAFAVAAPRGATALTGKLTIYRADGSKITGIPFTLNGAGRYVVSEAGIAREASAAPDMASSPDLVDPSDSDPTCGGDEQPRCRADDGSKSCDDGLVYDVDDLLCHVCGAHEQRRCRGEEGVSYCHDGFVYVTLTERCVACGKDQQPRCRADSGIESCDDGFEYSSSDGKCHAP